MKTICSPPTADCDAFGVCFYRVVPTRLLTLPRYSHFDAAKQLYVFPLPNHTIMKAHPKQATILALLAASISALAAPIVVPVSSTFDTGLDGWTSNTPAEISFVSSGGNAGGYVSITDTTDASSIISAPAKFLGDYSALNGVGTILFDHRVFTVPDASPYTYQLQLIGPGGNASWFGTNGSGTTPWTIISVPIQQSAFTLNSGSWSALLANVTDLQVNIEIVTSRPDIEGVDNVRIVPEPSAALLVLSSAALCLRRRSLRIPERIA